MVVYRFWLIAGVWVKKSIFENIPKMTKLVHPSWHIFCLTLFCRVHRLGPNQKNRPFQTSSFPPTSERGEREPILSLFLELTQSTPHPHQIHVNARTPDKFLAAFISLVVSFLTDKTLHVVSHSRLYNLAKVRLFKLVVLFVFTTPKLILISAAIFVISR